MTKEKFEGARERLFQNVEFNYFKNKPVNFKGKDQWEVSIKTNDPAQAEEWENGHLNVRHNGTSTKMPTEWTSSLNRKVFKNDGTPNEPVRVVDETRRPYSEEERKKIGNGSRGNVIVWQGHYDNEHGKGVSKSLTAMQIPRDMLQVYEGSMETVDFDLIGEVSKSDGTSSNEDLF
jgi:hypothetical protein